MPALTAEKFGFPGMHTGTHVFIGICTLQTYQEACIHFTQHEQHVRERTQLILKSSEVRMPCNRSRNVSCDTFTLSTQVEPNRK